MTNLKFTTPKPNSEPKYGLPADFQLDFTYPKSGTLDLPVIEKTSTTTTKSMTKEVLETFPSGAKREPKHHKSRPDLIDTYTLDALGYHLSFGARKHGERNWELGIDDSSYLQGIHRHLMYLTRGNCNEDHLSAIVFNCMGLRRNAETGTAGGTPVRVYTLDKWKEKMNA